MNIDVIRLAREAGAYGTEGALGNAIVLFDWAELERFTALVMEECAKLFDQPHKEYFGDEIQEAIRARKPA